MDLVGGILSFLLKMAEKNPAWAFAAILLVHGIIVEYRWDRSRLKVKELYKDIARLKQEKADLQIECDEKIKAIQERHISDLQSTAKITEKITGTMESLTEFLKGTVIPLLFQKGAG